MLDRVFAKLQSERIVQVRLEAATLDSPSIKTHSDGTGALKQRTAGMARAGGGFEIKIHPVAADARTVITVALLPGNTHDEPEGRELLLDLGPMPEGLLMLMDRAYEGAGTRQLVLSLGMVPVVPPKINRLDPWTYGRMTAPSTESATRSTASSTDSGPAEIFSRFGTRDVPLPRLPQLRPDRREALS